jgi:hypothetical protein
MCSQQTVTERGELLVEKEAKQAAFAVKEEPDDQS